MTDDTIANERLMDPAGMSSAPPPPVEPLSFSDKFIGILTEPSATYENVRAAGARTTDWLLPVLILAVVIGVATFLRFGNPEFMQMIMDKQTKELTEQVNSGTITQDAADSQMERFDSMKGFIKLSGTIGAAIGYVIVFFITCLLYWLAVRFGLRGDASFGLILSAVGLTVFISTIDQLVSLLLSFVTGNPFANLSAAMFTDGDVASKSTRFLMMLNPISIWATYVLGIGFEKVANISRVKGMIGAFAIWILFSIAGTFAGFGM